MRVLLTRAAEDAARTRRTLEAMGHEVVAAPVIRIVPLVAAWPTGAVDAVAASSAHAFMNRRDGPPPEARRLMPLLLVGARTREAARDAGFGGMAVTASSAGDLAALLPARRLRHVVYLAGRDRKPDMERTLRAVGETTVLETYEAQPARAFAPDAARALRPSDGALHYSRRSADLFLALARSSGVDAARLRHFALSADVAAALQGCPNVRVAEAPNEPALLALLDGRPERQA